MWTTKPARRLRERGAVTSIIRGAERTRPHKVAAERWLRSASGPQASTAASWRERAVSAMWPTAYTPRYSR